MDLYALSKRARLATATLSLAAAALTASCQADLSAGLPVLPGHEDRVCRPYVENALAGRGVTPGQIASISYAPRYPIAVFRGRVDEPTGFTAWVRLTSCETGYALVELTNTCQPYGISARGDCAQSIIGY